MPPLPFQGAIVVRTGVNETLAPNERGLGVVEGENGGWVADCIAPITSELGNGRLKADVR
jgi:hypothetical protein